VAKSAEDPPSPVDAYNAGAQPVLLADGAAPYAPAPPFPTAVQQPPASLNDLAVIALIASCVGLSIPGLVMGHLAMRQIKRSGDSGRGIALAAIIIGYAVTVIVLLSIVAFVVFMIAVLSTASDAVNTFGDFG
jgi:peptidyl-prolyl cis-trans isomerase B (cyclophilin B)